MALILSQLSAGLSTVQVAAFPKLSPLTGGTLRQYTTFSDQPKTAAQSIGAAAAGECKECKCGRAGSVKMQAEAAAEEAAVEAPPAPVAAPPAPALVVDAGYPTAALEALGGYDVETGGGIWDPLKLAAQPDADLIWYRQAEIKHGRVAMLACLGYVAAKSGLVFQGAISRDGTLFADLANSNPFAEWGSVPLGGKIQFALAAAAFELNAEQKMIDGGKVGEMPLLKKLLPWIPKKPPANAAAKARRDKQLLSEIKNGRLAMIGIAGFYASESIPGSVPFHF